MLASNRRQGDIDSEGCHAARRRVYPRPPSASSPAATRQRLLGATHKGCSVRAVRVSRYCGSRTEPPGTFAQLGADRGPRMQAELHEHALYMAPRGMDRHAERARQVCIRPPLGEEE